MRFILVITLFFTNTAYAENYGLSLFGDLKYPSDFTHLEYTNPDAPKGGEIKLAAIGSFDSLNSYILKGVPADGLSMTIDTLMYQTKDELFSQYGLIAESAEIAPDGKSITFTLRKEARWHDGTPITPSDVIFSLEVLKTKGHPSYRSYYNDVLSAKKTGNNQVTFYFANSSNRELPLIVGQMPVLSKKYFENNDFEKSGLMPILGNGPYMVESFEQGRRIVYRRVEDYWAKDLPVNKGRYNFDRIRYDYFRDLTISLEAFKAGTYDFNAENMAKNWAKAYNFDAVKDGLVIKDEITHRIPTGIQAYLFNIRRDKFKDIKVREALGLAFDFEWSNRVLFFNAYTRTQSYFSNSVYASSDLPSKEEMKLLEPLKEQIPETIFTKEFKAPITDGSGYNRESLRKAKKLLEEAGWKISQGKLRDSSGKIFEIEFLINSPGFERITGPYIKNLDKLGINAKIRTVDSAQYQKRMETFDFDMIVHVFTSSNSLGNEQIDYWHSSKADVPGSRNLIGIKNQAVDEMVEKLVHAKNKENLITTAKALDRILLNNHYVIPQWHVRSFRIAYWDKFGQPKTRPLYDLGLDSWWLDQEKDQKLKNLRK